MSGGALDYAFSKMNRLIEDIQFDIPLNSKNHIYLTIFIEHMKKISKCLQDVEWWLSGDTDEEDAINSIRTLMGESFDKESKEYIKNEIEKLITFYKELE